MSPMPSERALYRSTPHYLLNQVLLPLKLVVPQPVIAMIPGLTTNADIRVGMVAQAVRGRLLDVGCGANRLVRQYRQAGGGGGGDGIGVDVYPWDGVDKVVTDTAALPFADGAFDTITFIACLNHIPNRCEVLREARRLIAADGQLILTNLDPLVSKLWHAWAFWDADQHERGMAEGEVWGFKETELERLLADTGWRCRGRRRFSLGLNSLWLADPA